MIELLMVREHWLWTMNAAFAFMVTVPAVLSWYYHSRVRLLTGGKRLRGVQRELAPRHGNVAGNLSNAAEIWRRVQSGEFGPEARRLLYRCAAVIIAWVVILVVWFGILLYAEEQVKKQGGWPEPATESPAACSDSLPGQGDAVLDTRDGYSPPADLAQRNPMWLAALVGSPLPRPPGK